MTQEEMLSIAARIAAHERLIRDLLVNVIGRLERPLAAFDAYASNLTSKMDLAAAPGADAAFSDVLNQMISEAIQETLTAARSDLLGLLRQAAGQKRKPRQ